MTLTSTTPSLVTFFISRPHAGFLIVIGGWVIFFIFLICGCSPLCNKGSFDPKHFRDQFVISGDTLHLKMEHQGFLKIGNDGANLLFLQHGPFAPVSLGSPSLQEGSE